MTVWEKQSNAFHIFWTVTELLVKLWLCVCVCVHSTIRYKLHRIINVTVTSMDWIDNTEWGKKISDKNLYEWKRRSELSNIKELFQELCHSNFKMISNKHSIKSQLRGRVCGLLTFLGIGKISIRHPRWCDSNARNIKTSINFKMMQLQNIVLIHHKLLVTQRKKKWKKDICKYVTFGGGPHAARARAYPKLTTVSMGICALSAPSAKHQLLK